MYSIQTTYCQQILGGVGFKVMHRRGNVPRSNPTRVTLNFFFLNNCSCVGDARKVSPDWSQKTMTCHSFNCFSIVWGQG